MTPSHTSLIALALLATLATGCAELPASQERVTPDHSDVVLEPHALSQAQQPSASAAAHTSNPASAA